MKSALPRPDKRAIIYKDEKLYVCLASYPITKGHVVVVWKKKVSDLHLLDDRDYDYLMDTVDATRDAMLKVLAVKKVYLIYMDETRHVHWHLVPRYNEKGYDALKHSPGKLKSFALAKKIQKHLMLDA